MRLDPFDRVPAAFHASAEVLAGRGFDLVELRCGPARGSWNRRATEPMDRLRLVLLAPSPGGVGHWHGVDVDLARGAVALLGRTAGSWRVPAGLRGLQVNLPRSAFDVSDAELDRINQGRLLAGDPVYAALVRPMLLGLAGRLDTLAMPSGAELATVWTSLLRMLVRSLAGRAVDGVGVEPARRVQAERYIAMHLVDPQLTPGSVAAGLHVSRRALYACLPAPAAYIRQRRLERARSLLAGSPQPVAQVAVAVGLPNPAHFSRMFRAAYGYAPRDARAR